MSLNAQAECLLEVDARSLVYSSYYITDAFDYDLSKWVQKAWLKPFIPFVIFIWVWLNFDRVHFYCDRGIIPSPVPFSLNRLELILYKLMGLQVFFWTYGADVRTRNCTYALGNPNCCTECESVGKACICDNKKWSKNRSIINKYSTGFFSMGDMIEYTPGSRNDLFFWPVDLNKQAKYEPSYPLKNFSKPVRIVHAPNHRMFKGTHFLIDAVNNLKRKGLNIELVLVEGISNDRALEIYRSADIIFDQCLIGFHGYFALEGMAMGKPVMCFIRKPEEYLLHPEECPIINTHIDTLEDDLSCLIHNGRQLREIGIQGRSYIEKYYSLEAFASRLKEAYQDIGIE